MKKLLIFLAFLSLCSGGAKQASEPAPQNTKYVTEQTDDNYKDNYKSECKAVSFDEISKDPDALKGEKVTVKGKIINIIDNVYYISITQKDNGRYADTIAFRGAFVNNISKGDIVSIWGESKGFYEHTSSLGIDYKDPIIEVAFTEIEK
jgi:nanoRNase/pAp phosphatase (c-di-AMP/oligoRNAs hydrolase)